MFREISANHVKTWLDLNFRTPVHVALLEGGDFISFSDYARRAREDVIAWTARDSSNPPVTCLYTQDGDQACPAWCWFQPMGQLGKMDPSKSPRQCYWRQWSETDSRTFYKWSGIGSLVTVSQIVLTPCVTGCCWLQAPPHIVSPTLLLFCLSNQLEIRKSLCKVDPNLIQFLSLPFSDMPCYSRFEWTFQQRTVHATHGTQCNYT